MCYCVRSVWWRRRRKQSGGVRSSCWRWRFRLQTERRTNRSHWAPPNSTTWIHASVWPGEEFLQYHGIFKSLFQTLKFRHFYMYFCHIILFHVVIVRPLIRAFFFSFPTCKFAVRYNKIWLFFFLTQHQTAYVVLFC